MRTLALSWLIAILSATSTSAAPIPSKTETLRGTISAADGTPAAGATVWAAKRGHGPLVRQETIADAAGRYSLELEKGTWFVWARRGSEGAGGPARQEPIEVIAGRRLEPVVIRMEERGYLRGRLLEAETG